ncbi:MAG: hypothetical protein MI861_24095, partial [Pirellulales bacterium]|nr:hypothetical protein [Pirellulales bacterium]
SGEITTEYPTFNFKPTRLAQAANGTWICVGDDSGNAHLINQSDGSPRGSVKAHRGILHDVAIHPDAARWATCGADGLIRLWNQPSGNQQPGPPLHTWKTNAEEVIAALCLTFSPDRDSLFCGDASGKIHQWKIGDGRLVRTIDGGRGASTGPIRRLAITPNGQWLLSLGGDQTLRNWKVADGTPMHAMPHTAAVKAVSVSPDSKRAAVACDDGVIKIWDLNNGQLLQQLSGHQAPVVGVAYLPDGQTIASVSPDRTLRLAKTSIINAMAVHQGAINDMVPFGGGSQVLSCGQDGRIVLTTVSSGSMARQYKLSQPADDPVSDSAQPPNRRHFNPTAMALRDDQLRVAVGTQQGEVIVWNASSGNSPMMKLSLGAAVTSLAYSPDNQKLAVATGDQIISIYGPSVTGTRPAQELTLHQRFSVDNVVSEMSFERNSRSLWVALDSGQIQRWHYAAIEQQRRLNHNGPVYGVAISRDGKTVISCSADQTVRVWDTSNGQQKHRMTGHSGPVHAIAMSQDETFAVSSGSDGTLRLWDIIGGRQLKQLTKLEATMYSIAIDPKGQWIAAAGADRQVHVLNMITGEERHTLSGHKDYIHSVTFDSSGQRLISYGYAGYLKLWNPESGDLLREARIGKVGNHVQIAPDGQNLLLANGDGTARVVPLSLIWGNQP